ncbi:N-acetyl-anhydromuramyl-L-alanine amidase AmpD [Amycolatopsis arida]|uniref:N-acetyl-anhydromuramyl-L-alanine amidase AmpD n=1 Tax=Amycolatopsis arida TaxID=587909 RepID=A0A1I5R5M6_9PSEU|nr:N-acetylmuramoyl-L-alanine amidase [Amycolatopsis arida]TDX99074.1 N-acetyl-anhydromuramyl-L-alanine amidase AmpD [Amycolatopsis arida]SFP53366.1 N-acetyl-anhydromuramyl-L-alanine amidase AmpD [Amycolatopsis arida]
MANGPGFDRRALLKGGLTVTAVGALSTLPAGTAAAAVTEPRIYGTAEWGARPPRAPIPVENRRPTYIVVHHTVEPGNTDDFSRERAFWISRAIQNFHMDTRGWIDTGQQFTNSRGGHITEGRHRSLEILRGGTRHVQGTNVANNNSQVIGIENEGLYTQVDVPPALWNSLVKLVAYIASQYRIPTMNIKGHRDFNSTECPGGVLYRRLPELRQAVARELGVPATEPAEWPLLKPGDTGRDVLVAQHLLRARGARDVPTDGVFGATTRRAVARFADAHGLGGHTCYAGAHADERGFLGADLWPLLAPTTTADSGGDAGRAAALLTRDPEPLTPHRWKALLNA